MNTPTTASDGAAPPQLSRDSNLGVAAYLLHLAVPAFLLLDTVTAQLRGQIALEPVSPQAAVAAISALWLIAGLGFFFLSRDRRAFVAKVATPLLSVYTVCLALALVETLIRLMGFTPPIPGMQLKVIKAVTRADPAVTPGVSGTKVFTINRLGLRGPLPPEYGPAYRIVTIGGSTTICSFLDDSEEWPHRLMDQMNASQRTRPVWVGNAAGTDR